MAMIAPRVSVGARPHRVRFEQPGPPVPDGEGGWTESWLPLTPPEMFAEIRPLTAMDFEQDVPGTILAIATHVVTCPHHPQVTTKTRLLFNGREFSIEAVANREERSIELVLLCKEVVS